MEPPEHKFNLAAPAIQTQISFPEARFHSLPDIWPALDQGFEASGDRSGKANTGHALETAVLIELERRRCQVAYVKTPNGKEVDFIARDREGQTVYVQVCADLNTTEVCRREIEPFNEILGTRPNSDCLLLTLTTTDVAIAQKVATSEVTVRPAWEWLLEEGGR